MRRELDKIKRVKPVIRAREARVKQEAEALVDIRNKKVEIVTAMKDRQKRYMDGVEELNRQRAAPIRAHLEPLENGLDQVKGQWYQLFREVQTIEQQEKAQIAQLQSAESELRSVMKLNDKYELEFKKASAKNEQKQIDEHGLRKYIVD